MRSMIIIRLLNHQQQQEKEGEKKKMIMTVRSIASDATPIPLLIVLTVTPTVCMCVCSSFLFFFRRRVVCVSTCSVTRSQKKIVNRKEECQCQGELLFCVFLRDKRVIVIQESIRIAECERTMHR